MISMLKRKATYLEIKFYNYYKISCTQKFKAQWLGPYRIKKRIGRVNYELEMPECNRTKVLHCNFLKQWYPRTETRYTSIVKDSAELISPKCPRKSHKQEGTNRKRKTRFGETPTTIQTSY